MLSQDDISQLRRHMELREKRDEAKAALAIAEKEFRDSEADLYERLADGPVTRLNNVDLGPPWGKVSFGARETIYGRIIPGKEDEAREYFEQRAMVDEVTQIKFKDKRLNEIAREYFENAEQMPPGIDWYARRGVTITRQKD